jgi:glycosyltransferase involved in cell wall biosynthesis
MVDRLAAHCRSAGMRFLFDLDDDLVNLPADHPDAALLAPLSPVVAAMVRKAGAVWVSTEALARALGPIRSDARVVPNGLDERIWSAVPPPGRLPFGPVRILFMGTASHEADLVLVLPALERLHAEFGERVRIDVIGITGHPLPPALRRVVPPQAARASYPGFVNWMVQQHAWDVGIAPLVEAPFNVCKSAIKTMDYAALGLAVLASDIDVYRGSIADGAGGMLIRETPSAWYAALSRVVLEWPLLERLRRGAREAFPAYTLAAQAADRRRAWTDLVGGGRRRAAA